MNFPNLDPHQAPMPDYRAQTNRIVEQRKLQDLQRGILDCREVLPNKPLNENYRERAAYVVTARACDNIKSGVFSSEDVRKVFPNL